MSPVTHLSQFKALTDPSLCLIRFLCTPVFLIILLFSVGFCRFQNQAEAAELVCVSKFVLPRGNGFEIPWEIMSMLSRKLR